MSVYAKPAHIPSSPVLIFPQLRARLSRFLADRVAVLGLVLLGALAAFELFNYSTTEFALSDLLGGLSLGSLQWATILAMAFAAMDFAGIAWLFTPRQGAGGLHSWYLVSAWFLAASMNAMLTWWSVSLALVSHQSIGDLLIGQQALLRGVPVFVAALVWLLRILLIGSFTLRAPSVATVGQRYRRTRPSSDPADPQGRVPARLIRRGRAPSPNGHSLHDRHTARFDSR